MNERNKKKDSFFSDRQMKDDEKNVLKMVADNFEKFPIGTQDKLENFPNWVRHRDLARFLFKAEIYRSILDVPGVVFDCGVLFGGGLSTWLHLGEIYEPVNFSRRVFGFDSFAGFPEVGEQDKPSKVSFKDKYKSGYFNIGNVETHIREIFSLIDKTRKIPQIPRMNIIKGDARKTVPKVLENDKSILISLLYLDMDLYEPTKIVLAHCLPRMCKGAVICFDELCYEDWPGETQALFEFFDINNYKLTRSTTVPNISYLRL